jgi:hypothetical protein
MMNEEKEYIEGIFSYCDRWCERCAFCSQCKLFSLVSKIATKEILSGYKEQFYPDDLENDFDDSGEKLSPFFDHNFENDEDDWLKIHEAEREEFKKKENHYIENHLLTKISKEYLLKMRSLLQAVNDQYEMPMLLREISPEDENSDEITENVRILNYYDTIIYIKINRAIYEQFTIKHENNNEVIEFSVFDMNCSIKIAYLSLQKSITALENLLYICPQFRSKLSEVLILADLLVVTIKKEFPAFETYKRPGLDT